MPGKTLRIAYRNGPIVDEGKSYVARLTADCLEVDVTAPPAELVDAVWLAAHRVARRGMMLVPIVGVALTGPMLP